jgi:leader peptidase (prepilin peptidase)/N-methyltransferase
MVEALIALFGLAWGSFLNVVIYRLPHGLNLALPPSHCPQCETRIKLHHNIPVLSWVLLGGKCRSCGTKIPATYLLVEVLTPLSFLALYLNFGLSLHFFISCLFTSGLLALTFIDFYHQILPDQITLPGLVLGLAYAFFRDDLTLRQSLIGAVVGAGILLLVYGTYWLIRRREGLGMGDVTLMLMVGAFLGWRGSVLTLILGSFLGALVGVYIIVVRKQDTQFALPFGTFLAPAAFVALVWGERIITWYLGMFQAP